MNFINLKRSMFLVAGAGLILTSCGGDDEFEEQVAENNKILTDLQNDLNDTDYSSDQSIKLTLEGTYDESTTLGEYAGQDYSQDFNFKYYYNEWNDAESVMNITYYKSGDNFENTNGYTYDNAPESRYNSGTGNTTEHDYDFTNYHISLTLYDGNPDASEDGFVSSITIDFDVVEGSELPISLEERGIEAGTPFNLEMGVDIHKDLDDLRVWSEGFSVGSESSAEYNGGYYYFTGDDDSDFEVSNFLYDNVNGTVSFDYTVEFENGDEKVAGSGDVDAAVVKVTPTISNDDDYDGPSAFSYTYLTLQINYPNF